ncbi:MAG: V-type ATP synthase subunit D [Candidatus Brocadiia bacterium]
MPRQNVAPTRRNYLEIQRTLERVQRGHELLDKKRQILVTELMSKMEAARRVKEQVDEAMKAAYEALRQAAVQSGMTGLKRAAAGVRMAHRLNISSHSVMGVPVPRVECTPDEFGLQFGIADGGSHRDEVMQRFLEALPLVAELAEVENAVFRLARELRRTQRRVNALEKTYIPSYKESLKFIEETLAERQREEFIVLRKVKRKREQALHTGRSTT